MALMATSGKDWKRWDALFWSQSRVALPWIWKRLRGEAPSHILPTGYLEREFLPGEGGGDVLSGNSRSIADDFSGERRSVGI